MTTIVVVKKHDQVVIAADSQTTFGDDHKLSADYDCFHDKIFEISGNYIGISGSAAHDMVLQQALRSLKKIDLSSRTAIFNTFRKLHPKLKEQFFMRPEEDEEDPYESSQMMLLLANANGIFGVYPMREVYEFSRFWAIGSGRKYAMGAIFTCYDQEEMDAEALARLGIQAGCEFDNSSSLPLSLYKITLNYKKPT